MWSVCGSSAKQEAEKFTESQDESVLEAGFMWQKLTRTSKEYGIKASTTSFVEKNGDVEILLVEIENVSDENIVFTPFAVIPIYGRSADNIRDHRHVTSLLHQIKTTDYGVEVKPKLSFDERGHRENRMTYVVAGVSESGEMPREFYPVVEDFIGEGGCFERPLAIVAEQEGVKAGCI